MTSTATTATALKWDSLNRLRCSNDDIHAVTVFRGDTALRAVCLTCWSSGEPLPDPLASLAWYADHNNLALLFGWIGEDVDARHVAEKPWKWEDEYHAAAAVAAHEQETEQADTSLLTGRAITYGHTVYRGDDDTQAYCNDCAWEFRDGQVGQRQLDEATS